MLRRMCTMATTGGTDDYCDNFMKKAKVVFLGDKNVGKTSLITRFMYDYFESSYHATIGIDFLSRTVYLDDSRQVRLQLWDTAGQERFRALVPAYIRDSAVAVVVYDISCQESFKETEGWIKEARKERGNEVKVVLVGNKSDLGDKRQVTNAMGRQLAEHLNAARFIETSAKTGANVNLLFRGVAETLWEFEEKTTQVVRTSTINLAVPDKKNHWCRKCSC